MGQPVDLNNRDQLIQNAITSLSSKVVSQRSDLLAPMAVDAVLHVIDKEKDTNVDLRDILVSKKLGGTVDDSELIDGLVFVDKKVSHFAGGPTRIQDAKIGLIQFCLSAPKTDMENNVVVHDYNVEKIMAKHKIELAAKEKRDTKRNKAEAKKVWKMLIRRVVAKRYVSILFDRREQEQVDIVESKTE